MSYLVLHSFEENQTVRIPVDKSYVPECIYEAETHDFWFEEGMFVVKMEEAYDAMAFLFRKAV